VTLPRWLWAVLVALFFIILLLGSLFVLPQMLVDRTIASRKAQEPTIADRLKAENDVRTTLLQAIGAVGAALAVVITWRQFQATLVRYREDRLNSQEQLEISREGQVTERFTRAIDQLGSATLDIRLGGIYALERIAKDSPRDHGPIMEVLTAFVRERARWKDDQPPEPAVRRRGSLNRLAEGRRSPKPSADIQAILTVLDRRVIDEKWPEPRTFDLSKTDLRGASLRGTHLDEANLIGTHLEGAVLRDIHLEYADLDGAHLEGAVLPLARLGGADLPGAHLEGALLLTAYLRGANLSGAYLHEADLSGAHLEKANLRGAHLEGANLSGAYLHEADLSGAYLHEASIAGTHFEGALHLTKEQIDSAYADFEQYRQAQDKRVEPTGSDQPLS
jgi:hypothetical protein